MNLNLKSKQLFLITLALSLMFKRENVRIVILPNLSNLNQKYWVGEKHSFIIKN